VADLPLRTATDLRLGRPLPHQLANLTQAHPIAAEAFPPQGLCGISTSFPVLSPTIGQIPTRYSPVRHSSAPSKLGLLPFDLHVLSMPPAFNLSQDQTLQFNLSFLLPSGRSKLRGKPRDLFPQGVTNLYGLPEMTGTYTNHLNLAF
jgi:hypothetical protein